MIILVANLEREKKYRASGKKKDKTNLRWGALGSRGAVRHLL